MSYECEITIGPGTFSRRYLANLGSVNEWDTSFDPGDPVSGDGKWFRYSQQRADYDSLYDDMLNMVIRLRKLGIVVVREKIDKTVHDVQYD